MLLQEAMDFLRLHKRDRLGDGLYNRAVHTVLEAVADSNGGGRGYAAFLVEHVPYPYMTQLARYYPPARHVWMKYPVE